MSTVVDSLVTKLQADAVVTSLVVQRIYPVLLIEGAALPAIVLFVVDDVPENSLTGRAELVAANARVQVDCYARHYKQAQQVGEAVKAVLGNLQAPELGAWWLASRDLYDNVTQYHRVSMDFGVWH